jgi:hypothetical protein
MYTTKMTFFAEWRNKQTHEFLRVRTSRKEKVPCPQYAARLKRQRRCKYVYHHTKDNTHPQLSTISINKRTHPTTITTTYCNHYSGDNTHLVEGTAVN